MVLKDENEPLANLPATRRLKICTFKSEGQRLRLGELLLKIAFDVAIKKGVNEIYLTHCVAEADPLAKLITDYRFSETISSNNETIFINRLFHSKCEMNGLSPIDVSKNLYPSYSDSPHINKFIIPIIPKYHDRLFIEHPRREIKLPEFSGQVVVEGNTIKKAYLCYSKLTKIRPGDILLFYRSHDEHCLTALGTVESARRTRNKDEIVKAVGLRTVYSIEEIAEIAKKPTLVLMFRWHFNFKKPVSLEKMVGARLIKRAPLSIIQIQHDIYRAIKQMGEFDERFALN
jgi:hypothetical protein